MVTKTPKTKRWVESVSGFDAVDEDAGVIHGVKVIGVNSRNKRKYKESALLEAVGLYEGARVYIDHSRPGKGNAERSVRDRWGQLRSVHVAEDGGLRAELHYLKSHPMTAQLVESAQRFPESFGLSHDANGEEEMVNGRREVVRIHRVNSVDVVNDPACNKGLFESVGTPMKIKEILASNKSKFKKILEAMMEADPAMGEIPVDMPMEDPVEDANPEDQIDAAFRAAMMAVLDDDALDTGAKLKKLKAILGAKDEATGAVGGEEEMPGSEMPTDEEGMTSEDDPASDKKKNPFGSKESMSKTELGNLREEVSQLKAENDLIKSTAAVKSLLESKKRDVTDVRVKALLAVPEADRVALVESWNPSVGSKPKPTASPSAMRESASGADASEYPKTPEEFRRRLV